MTDAIDFSSYTTVPDAPQFACLKQQGVRRVIIGTSGNRLFPAQAQACLDAGLEVQVYVFLDARLPGDYQVARALDKMRPFPSVRMLWLDIEADPNRPQATPAMWCQCLQEARRAAAGWPVGIYTSRSMWALTGGSTDYADLPLWDAAYNGAGTAFLAYGGWTSRVMHQYSPAGLCGGNFDLNTIEQELEEDDVKPFLVLEAGTPNTWLIGFTAPIMLGSQAEIDSLAANFGKPTIAVSKGTIDQMAAK